MDIGDIDTLTKYPMVMRYRKDPLPNCKERNKRPCPANGTQASAARTSPSFNSPQHMKQEPISPATPSNYYNAYGMPSFQQSMYPASQGQSLHDIVVPARRHCTTLGFANYPMGNGFYNPYSPMGWNAPQYGYPAPMQQDYYGWQQQQQPRPDQHMQQQMYSDVNTLKR